MKIKIAIVVLCFLNFTGCCEPQEYRWHKTHSRHWNDLELSYNLLIQTEPLEARIYVNDRYIGVSPVKYNFILSGIKAVQSGKQPYTHYADDCGNRRDYNFGDIDWNGDLYPLFSSAMIGIRAFKDGYREESCTIQLESGNDNIRAIFKGISPDDEGRIPYTVLLDDAILLKLDPRPQRSGNGGEQQQTTVVDGHSTSSYMKKVGTVFVRSNTDNAEVYVDGFFMGNAPITLKLSEGSHIIEVRGDGRQIYKREVKVAEDAELVLNENFK